MTVVIPRFWHGDTHGVWLLVEPTALKRLIQIEAAVFAWKQTIAVKQS